MGILLLLLALVEAPAQAHAQCCHAFHPWLEGVCAGQAAHGCARDWRCEPDEVCFGFGGDDVWESWSHLCRTWEGGCRAAPSPSEDGLPGRLRGLHATLGGWTWLCVPNVWLGWSLVRGGWKNSHRFSFLLTFAVLSKASFVALFLIVYPTTAEGRLCLLACAATFGAGCAGGLRASFTKKDALCVVVSQAFVAATLTWLLCVFWVPWWLFQVLLSGLVPALVVRLADGNFSRAHYIFCMSAAGALLIVEGVLLVVRLNFAVALCIAVVAVGAGLAQVDDADLRAGVARAQQDRPTAPAAPPEAPPALPPQPPASTGRADTRIPPVRLPPSPAPRAPAARTSTPRPLCAPTCIVCLTEAADHAYSPCGHRVACGGCAEQLTATGGPCPVCRAAPEKLLRIY